MEGPVPNPLAVPARNSQHYFLQRPLWRSALWGVLGTGVVIGAIWVRDAAGLKAPNAPPFAHVAPFFIPIGLFIAQYLLPRVRVDVDGIHRRILWWWDLWPWEDFTEGRVTHGTYIYGYRHTGKPFWSQRLELSALEPEAARKIDGLIKRLWTPAAPPECPETLVLTLKEFGRPVLTLTAEGLSFTRKGQTVSSNWADLPMVTLWRLAADRPDFRRLIFVLSDRMIRLAVTAHNGQQLQTWTGPPAEVVSTFVLKYARRLEDYANTGDARSLDELEAKAESQLGGLEHRATMMKRCCWAVGALCLASPLACPWPMAMLMSLYLLMTCALYRDAKLKLETTRADLDRQRELLMRPAGSLSQAGGELGRPDRRAASALPG